MILENRCCDCLNLQPPRIEDRTSGCQARTQDNPEPLNHLTTIHMSSYVFRAKLSCLVGQSRASGVSWSPVGWSWMNMLSWHVTTVWQVYGKPETLGMVQQFVVVACTARCFFGWCHVRTFVNTACVAWNWHNSVRANPNKQHVIVFLPTSLLIITGYDITYVSYSNSP